MASHPYLEYIEGKEPLQCLQETPRRIEALVRAWPAASFERSYAPGKWTAAQILVHLAQAEMVFATRVRFALAEDGHVIQTFEQDDWMAIEPAVSGIDALDAYVGLRRMTLTLCRSLSAAQRARTSTHPDFGTISVEWMIGWLAGHDLNHLPQFEAIAAAS